MYSVHNYTIYFTVFIVQLRGLCTVQFKVNHLNLFKYIKIKALA